VAPATGFQLAVKLVEMMLVAAVAVGVGSEAETVAKDPTSDQSVVPSPLNALTCQ
jgi:hypothetical protein